MREDLNKLLCEHERYGSYRSFKDVRRKKQFVGNGGEELENLPRRESMKTRYDWNWSQKEFGENLNPLYGQVKKAVGRKWDDFYSELRKTFDTRSVINQHILIHLYSYIDVQTFVDEDGDVATHSAYRGAVKIKDSGTQYYVDPRDGIIKRNKRYKSWKKTRKEIEAERKREREKEFRWIGTAAVMYLEDGVWFTYQVAKLKPSKIEYANNIGDKAVDVRPAWMSRLKLEPKMKVWGEMNASEQERFGRAVVSNLAFDAKLKRNVYLKAGGAVYSTYYGHDSVERGDVFSRGMYHVSKATASHKELKQAGIIK